MSSNGGRAGKAYTALRRLVLHRDGPVCSMCNRPCRLTGSPLHPQYATIDHIRPLSQARSPHERKRMLLDPANCRVACRQCNTVRGAGATIHHTSTNPLDGW